MTLDNLYRIIDSYWQQRRHVMSLPGARPHNTAHSTSFESEELLEPASWSEANLRRVTHTHSSLCSKGATKGKCTLRFLCNCILLILFFNSHFVSHRMSLLPEDAQQIFSAVLFLIIVHKRGPSWTTSLRQYQASDASRQD